MGLNLSNTTACPLFLVYYQEKGSEPFCIPSSYSVNPNKGFTPKYLEM